MFADTIAAPLEIKALGGAETGTFVGYGAVYDVEDIAGDICRPGCFAQSIAERKTRGAHLPMHLNHGLPELGGVRGVGVWTKFEEDGKGLRVEGKVSGMNTDAGRLLYERVRDGALGGLSIGYSVMKDGATFPRREPGRPGPRREIKAARLLEVSLTDDPCNPHARVESVKSRIMAGELPDVREFEAWLREAAGFSRAQAEHIAVHGFKSLTRRDGAGGEANDAPEAKAAAMLLREALGFTLPTLR